MLISFKSFNCPVKEILNDLVNPITPKVLFMVSTLNPVSLNIVSFFIQLMVHILHLVVRNYLVSITVQEQEWWILLSRLYLVKWAHFFLNCGPLLLIHPQQAEL